MGFIWTTLPFFVCVIVELINLPCSILPYDFSKWPQVLPSGEGL